MVCKNNIYSNQVLYPLLNCFKYENLKNWEEEYKIKIEELLKIDSNSLLLNYSYGKYLSFYKEFGLADKYFIKCIKDFPEFQNAYIEKAICEYNKPKPNYFSGDSLINTVISRNPKNYYAMNIFAQSLAIRENFDAAISVYSDIVKVNSTFMDSYSELIRLLFIKGNHNEALSLTDKVYNLIPETPALNYQLGLVFNRYQNTEKSIYHLKRQLKMGFFGLQKRQI